jgi:hypothetical protein
LLPSLDAAEEGLGIGIAQLPVLHCPTGRGVFIYSGAVKDDFLLLRNLGLALLKLGEGDGHVQMHFLESGLVFVGTDEDRLPRLHMSVRFLGLDPDSRHDTTSFTIYVFLTITHGIDAWKRKTGLLIPETF